MSASDTSFIPSIFILILGVFVGGLYLYSAVWAIRIKNALMSPLFRDRARWVGITALTFVILISANLVIRFLAPENFYLSFLLFFIVDAAGIVTLIWIDIAIKLARRSDPLNRNTFRWKQLRYFVWFFTFLTTIGSLVSVAYLHSNYFNATQGTGGAFIAGSFGWVFLGLLALYLSFRRSKDPILKDHLKWLALFLFTLLIVDTVLSGHNAIFQIADLALLAVSAYFLYRA
ncbi:MAG: hypothetical protein ACHQ1H_15180, partial [Nitrososphaerales archaeon]